MVRVHTENSVLVDTKGLTYLAKRPVLLWDYASQQSNDCLDHVIVLNEDHLRRLLREYVDYYNDERVHTSIADAPVGRPVESRPYEHAKVVGLPRVGGLHHRYSWREAS